MYLRHFPPVLAGEGPRPPAREWYLTVRARFVVSVAVALLWAAFSGWISAHWARALAGPLTMPLALLVIAGVAVVPGYLNIQLLMSLLLDHPRPLRFDLDFPRVALVVAAYNEAAGIERMLEYARAQDYPAPLEIVVADDGSTDGTPELVEAVAREDARLRLVRAPHGGKALALNRALAETDAPLVATIDADTLLMPWALRHAVARLQLSPPDTVAIAGAVLVQNSRRNLLTKIQEWDYFLGISSVKRQQALWQATLVAQGAFSVYRRQALVAAGGWPDKIGEDIVLTWAMIRDGGRTTFEATASGFTEVPARVGEFVRQRQRWARGMIEGLQAHGLALLARRRLYVHAIGANLLFPYLDATYTFAFLPGVVLACFGWFGIAGPMTLAVLPLNLATAAVMWMRQRQVFEAVGLRIRRNYGGLAVYLLVYTPLIAPIAVAGYLLELARRPRSW